MTPYPAVLAQTLPLTVGWEKVGIVTLLVFAISALYLGLVSPRYIVVELKKQLEDFQSRASKLEKENADLNATVLDLTRANGEMKIEVVRLTEQVDSLTREIRNIRESRG